MERLNHFGVTDKAYYLVGLGVLKSARSANWMNKNLFRFGASSLANDVLMQLKKQDMGIYQSADYFSKD